MLALKKVKEKKKLVKTSLKQVYRGIGSTKNAILKISALLLLLNPFSAKCRACTT